MGHDIDGLEPRPVKDERTGTGDQPPDALRGQRSLLPSVNFVLDLIFAAPCHPSGLTNQQRLAVLENLPRWVNWRIEFADQNGGPAAARAEVAAMKGSKYAAMLSELADEALAAHFERAGNRATAEGPAAAGRA